MGIWELTLTAIIALIVLGPERMVTLARQLGRFWQRVHSLREQVKQDWDQQLKQTQLAENEAKAQQADKAYR